MDAPKEKPRRNKGWDNLIPARKGEPSRNPKGRPKKVPWAELFERFADEKVPNMRGITFRELHSQAPLRFVKDFRFWLAAYNIFHKSHPEARPQSIELTGRDGAPLVPPVPPPAPMTPEEVRVALVELAKLQREQHAAPDPAGPPAP